MAQTLTEDDYQRAARGSVASAAQLQSEVERTGMTLQQTVDLASQGLLRIVPSKPVDAHI